MSSALRIIASLLLLYSAHFIYNFITNVVTAKQIGLPTVFVPVDHGSLLWLIVSAPNTSRRRLQRILPAWLWRRVTLSIPGWEHQEKTRPFDEFAPSASSEKTSRSFVLVGLRRFEVWTADPTAVHDIVTRIRDFEVPKALGDVVGRFGPNVVTTNGDQWARHRRTVASVLNERISKTVFEESIAHSQAILGQLLCPANEKTDKTDTLLLFDQLTEITLKVLVSTVLGHKVPWLRDRDDEEEPEPGYRMTYTKSLEIVIDNSLGVAILPVKVLTRWPSWAPGYRHMTTVGSAMVEVAKRNREVLHKERGSMTSGGKSGSAHPDLVSNLVEASEQGRAAGQSLSEEEMVSNMFIFTAAGFKTTAVTLAYAVVLLARLPQWQDWLLEEVDSLLDSEGTEPMEYAATFPKAVRMFAFLMETVRLYVPIPRLFRKTASAQALKTSVGTIHLPANTSVLVNSVVLHRLPSIWRDINHQSDPATWVPDPNLPDEQVFRPSRWINPPGSAQTHFHPPKGAWLAWSGGPRICPGQKMAQLEFTAVMLTLLRRHRVQATPLPGEERLEIDARLDAHLRNSDGMAILQMNGIYKPKDKAGLSVRITRRR